MADAGRGLRVVLLGVIAGDEVAYAHGLLRCAAPEDLAANPERRLRLTIGLRKEERRWVVAHEHHSYADTTQTSDSGQ